MAWVDHRPQAVRRDEQALLAHLQTFALDLKFSAGIWYFAPGGGRFHDRYTPPLTIPARLEIAARLKDYGLAALEAHYPNEINEDNLDQSAIGLTGQMHGLVLLDESRQVFRPAILWNDQRSGAQCAEIVARVGGLERLLQLTGNAVLPGFTAPKILWVRAHGPHIHDRIAHILLPKDYVRYRLTGEFATEVSDASGTSLFDVAHRRWSAEMSSALDIPAHWLPRCTESTAVSGRVSAEAARATGLRQGIPVVGVPVTRPLRRSAAASCSAALSL